MTVVLSEGRGVGVFCSAAGAVGLEQAAAKSEQATTVSSTRVGVAVVFMIGSDWEMVGLVKDRHR